MFTYSNEFQKIRYQEKDRKGHLCSTPLEENEKLSLAFVKGYKNHLICENCAEFLINKGVSYVDMSKRNKG